MNPTARSTPKELFSVLEKSGINVPLGTGISRSSIKNQAIQNDPVIEKRKQEYKQKIDRLANIDQQIGGMFGEGGQFALENPIDRERIAVGRHNIGLKNADLSLDQIKQREDEIKGIVDNIFDLHQELISEAQKATGSKKSEAQKLKEYADIDIAENAGVYNVGAQQVFLGAPVAFQKWWLRELLSGIPVPDGGFDRGEVKEALKIWNKLVKSVKDETSAKKPTNFRF